MLEGLYRRGTYRKGCTGGVSTGEGHSVGYMQLTLHTTGGHRMGDIGGGLREGTIVGLQTGGFYGSALIDTSPRLTKRHDAAHELTRRPSEDQVQLITGDFRPPDTFTGPPHTLDTLDVKYTGPLDTTGPRIHPIHPM